MAFTAQQQQDSLKLGVGLFGAALGSYNLNVVATFVNQGYTVAQAYDIILASPVAQTGDLYPSFLDNEQFATRFVNNLVGSSVGSAAKTQAVALVKGLLEQPGVTRGAVAKQIIDLLDSVSHDDPTWGAAATQFDNRVAVASYYSIDKGQSADTVGALQAVLGPVTADAASVTAAMAAIDANILASKTYTLSGVSTVSEGSTAVFTLTTNAAEGTVLGYTISGVSAADVTGGLTGTATVSGGKATISVPTVADNSTEGAETLVLALDNGKATITTTVLDTSVNVAPTFAAATATASTAENSTTVYTAAATDTSNDAVTYSLSGTDAAKFAVDSATGVVTFRAAPNYEVDAKSYSFNVVATDKGGLTASQAVTVNVTDVNEAPTAGAAATASVAENSTAVGTYAATDVDAGDTLTYSLTGTDAAKFSVAAGGVVTFAAAPNYEVDAKSYSINVVATDKGGLTSTQAVTVNVTDVNEAPTAGAAATASVAENSTAVGTYAATDVDAGDTLTYTLTGADAAKFTVDAGGVVAFAAAPNYEVDAKSYAINVVATDKGGLASTQAVTVGVTNVNEAPTAVADTLATQALASNNTYVIDISSVTANDTDVDAGDTLSIVSVADRTGGGGTVSLNGGTKVVFIANDSTIRTGSFDYTIKDAGGLTSTATASFIINSAPVGTAGTAAATEDTVFTGNVVATDVNGDTMTYAVGTTTTKGTLALAADGSYTYTPNANFNGTDSFTFTATDSYGSTSTAATVNITVASVNDAPSGTASALSVKAGAATATTGQLAVADVDLDATLNAVVDTLTYTVDNTGTVGTVTIDASTGTYSYTPTAGQQGGATDSFKVTVTDKAGLSNTATVNVSVTNTAPVATDFALTAKTGVTQTVDLTGKATDAEGQTLTPTVVLGTVSSGGSAEVKNGAIVYTSTIGFVGTETVNYTVADGYGGTSNTGTITFTVTSNTGGTSGDDLLYGSKSAEAIDGLAGNDTINGGGGLDTITGGDGNDRVTFSDGASQIQGGNGVDTLVVNSDAVAATYDFSSTTQQNGDSNSKNSLNQTVVLRGFENLDGSLAANGITFTDGTTTTTVITGNGADNIQFSNFTSVATVTLNDGNDVFNQKAGVDYAVTVDAGAGNDTVTTQNGNDSLLGGTGNDTITVNNGTNTVSGGAGDDTITDGTGNSVLTGDAGNDTITAGSGNDNVSGGDGDDTFTFAGNLTTGDTVAGGAGNDTLSANAGAVDSTFTNVSTVEILTLASAGSTTIGSTAQTAGIVTVNGNAGADVINATGYTTGVTFALNGGNDNVSAGSGNDTFTFSGTNLDASDTINGGAGTDTIKLDNSAAGVTATIDFDTVTNLENVLVGTASGANATSAEAIALTITTLTTTTTNTITIDASVITDTNDTFALTNSAAAAQNFSIKGGAGTDTLAGSTGNDTINGGSGADSIDTGNGNNVVTGDAGNDTVTVGTGTDNVSGGDGDDTFTFAGNLTSGDTVAGGAGNDTLSANSGAVDSTFTNVSTVEILTLASAGSTTIGSTAQTAGIVTVNGNAGADVINATGYTTGVTFVLGAGDDNVSGGSGNDTFTFSGTNLNDSDTLNGGTGTDTLSLDNSAAGVTATIDFDAVTNLENVVVSSASGANATSAEAIALTITTLTTTTTNTITIDASVITDTNDTFELTNSAAAAQNFSIKGGAGTDTLAGSTGNDTINGGSGADSINTGNGNNVVTGDAGNDTVTVGTGTDNVSGGDGDDTFTFAANLAYTDTLVGGAGNDTLSANAGAVDSTFTNVSTVEILTLASAGSTTIGSTAQTAGIVTVNGNAGADVINATGYTTGVTFVLGAGDDNVSGGSGNDTFTFSGTNLNDSDTLNGGTGTDTLSLDNSAAGVTATIDFDAVTNLENVLVGTASGASSGTAETVGLTITTLTTTTTNTITIDASVITDTNDTFALTNSAAAAQNFSIKGGAGANTLAGSSGHDTIVGGASADNISGGSGNDSIVGGAGADTIDSGTGLDTISGGAGADNFSISTPANGNSYATITDAAAGDILTFANKGTETFTSAKIVLANTAVFQDYLDAAVTGDGSTNGAFAWFQYNGDTYLVEDRSAGSTFTNNSDVVIKLTGLLDLSTVTGGTTNILTLA